MQIYCAVAKGVVPVAAAGNEFGEGNPLEFPASLPHVLTVAATGPDDRAAYFSNPTRGRPERAGRGHPGRRCRPPSTPTATQDGYALVSGTSFSAPMVSAAVAWVRAARPELTPDQAAQAVRLGARDVGKPGLGRADRLRRAQRAGRAHPRSARRRPRRAQRQPRVRQRARAGRPREGDLHRCADRAGRARSTGTRTRSTSTASSCPRAPPYRCACGRAFGDPDLSVFTPAAATVTRTRGLVARSHRRGRRTDGLRLRNRTGRRETRFVVVAIDDRVKSLGRRLHAADQRPAGGGAHCCSARSPVPSSAAGVGTCGLSRRYHSASSAAWQPEPAAVTAWR